MPFTGTHDADRLRLMYRALDTAWLELEQRGQCEHPGELRLLMGKRIMAEAALGETNVGRLRMAALAAVDSEIDS